VSGSDTGIVVLVPEQPPIRIHELATDFNGTLALDGELLPGVAERLSAIAARIRVTVLTADTFGTAERVFQEMPVKLFRVSSGREKEEYVISAGAGTLAAMGNGRNDQGMMRRAALAVAVAGSEGLFPGVLRTATVVVPDPATGLDLFLHPDRLVATLRA
jgi:soluble P-type ATPase